MNKKKSGEVLYLGITKQFKCVRVSHTSPGQRIKHIQLYFCFPMFSLCVCVCVCVCLCVCVCVFRAEITISTLNSSLLFHRRIFTRSVAASFSSAFLLSEFFFSSDCTDKVIFSSFCGKIREKEREKRTGLFSELPKIDFHLS